MGFVCLAYSVTKGDFIYSRCSLTSKSNLCHFIFFHICTSTFVNKVDLVFSAYEINSKENVLINSNSILLHF